MPDIRLDTGFLGNLKTRKLLKDLGDHGVVCTIRLWSYAGERHKKGVLVGFTLDDLEEIAGWTGERGAYASYAVRMRWVDAADDGTLSIHDWNEHQPWVFHSEKRIEAAKIGAAKRWEKRKVNAPRIRSASVPHAEGNAPSPTPSPLPLDQKKSQERVTRPGNGRFTVPTIEQVSEYCESRKNSVDPVKWYAHYTSNGWRVGKNPMKNWKAAIVTWEKG
jgi:hypothetical protein